MQIQVNGKIVFFDVEGEGWARRNDTMVQRPTLILLHGAPGNSDHSVFKPDFSVLADAMQIIYLD
ncbi:MAG: alpha/beta hydrolase, partial [Rhodobacteraceae bacterium]|nr:alpha/beta hydrolase [Paracoccaceae bacterium]